MYYGGEALSADQPQSLTCPFCGKMGYTETSLQDHVTADHPDTAYEVVRDTLKIMVLIISVLIAFNFYTITQALVDDNVI